MTTTPTTTTPPAWTEAALTSFIGYGDLEGNGCKFGLRSCQRKLTRQTLQFIARPATLGSHLEHMGYAARLDSMLVSTEHTVMEEVLCMA